MSEAKSWDWFIPAIQSNGSVEASLSAVARIEESRLLFIKSLQRSLCQDRGSYSDAVSCLRAELGVVNKTLESKLGMLDKSRPQAWFRAGMVTEPGPFPARVDSTPIFAEFAPQLAKKIRNEILLCWRQFDSEIDGLPPGDCLWRKILLLNCRWYQICTLAEPFQDLRLDELPEGLPDDLYCQSLQRFLSKVNQLVSVARQELDDCFNRLFGRSEDFLLSYYKKPSGFRASAVKKVPKPVVKALEFMDFVETPDQKSLKRRYFELAKTYHPDAVSGSDSLFLSLKHHYQTLLKFLP